MRIIGPLTLLIAVSFALIGGGVAVAWRQHEMLHDYRPRPARVVEAEVMTLSAHARRPRITVEYREGLETLRTSRLSPLPVSGPAEWAQAIVDEHAAGRSVTVYVDPRDPTRAYLLPVGRFAGHGLVLGGVALLLLGFFPLRTSGLLDPAPYPVQTSRTGWFRLAHTPTPVELATIRLAESGLGLVAGVVVVGHYLLTAPRPYDPWVFGALGYAAVLAVPTVQGVALLRAGARFAAPRVSTTLPTIHLDQPVIARVELPAVRPVTVHRARLSLVCHRRTGVGSQRHFVHTRTVAEDVTIRPGEPLFAECTFEVPASKRRPSNRYHRLTYPRIDWHLELWVHPRRGGVFTLRFPIEAQRGHTDDVAAAPPSVAA